MRLVKRSFFNVHDVYGAKLLTVTFVVTGIITIFIVLNHPVPAKRAWKIINPFPCTACVLLLSVRPFFDMVSNLVGIDVMHFSSEELCTLLLYVNNDFSYLVNRGVIEEAIKYIKTQSDSNEIERLWCSHK